MNTWKKQLVMYIGSAISIGFFLNNEYRISENGKFDIGTPLLSHYARNSPDDRHVASKDVAGLTVTGMSIEDRVHRMYLSLLNVESSNIALQSVLKKKEKEETCIT